MEPKCGADVDRARKIRPAKGPDLEENYSDAGIRGGKLSNDVDDRPARNIAAGESCIGKIENRPGLRRLTRRIARNIGCRRGRRRLLARLRRLRVCTNCISRCACSGLKGGYVHIRSGSRIYHEFSVDFSGLGLTGGVQTTLTQLQRFGEERQRPLINSNLSSISNTWLYSIKYEGGPPPT